MIRFILVAYVIIGKSLKKIVCILDVMLLQSILYALRDRVISKTICIHLLKSGELSKLTYFQCQYPKKCEILKQWRHKFKRILIGKGEGMQILNRMRGDTCLNIFFNN